MLSADCFGAFEDVGLDNDDAVRATGRRFRDTVLAFGGGRAPEKVFHDFRGRGDDSLFVTRCFFEAHSSCLCRPYTRCTAPSQWAHFGLVSRTP